MRAEDSLDTFLCISQVSGVRYYNRGLFRIEDGYSRIRNLNTKQELQFFRSQRSGVLSEKYCCDREFRIFIRTSIRQSTSSIDGDLQTQTVPLRTSCANSAICEQNPYTLR